MTVNKLIAELEKIRSAGGGRLPVAVNKDSLDDGKGTFQICGVSRATVIFVGILEGDGFVMYRRDGSERLRRMVVLSGEMT